ncbi:MAG: CidA/LrgA family protein [Neisseria sp.]|nr:CidA/LrgA family protein [Neisseria sp.]
MYLLRALSVIFGCLAVGEAVIYWTGWQLPGSVIGLGVLLALLHLGWVDVKWLVQMVNLLLDNLPLFLVPPCVAVMTYLDVVAKDFWSITIASILSTFAVLFATGKTHEWMRRR